MRRALTTLEDECARLREQAGQTSRISSKPPASAPPRVLYRHTSFGTRGDAGSRAVERLLTVSPPAASGNATSSPTSPPPWRLPSRANPPSPRHKVKTP